MHPEITRKRNIWVWSVLPLHLVIHYSNGISSLFDKSLFSVADSNDEPRFIMLETIREYGLSCLEEQAELNLVVQAHASYYLNLAQQAEPYLAHAEQRIWLERLAREYDNLLAALNYLLKRQAYTPALKLAGALWRFWRMRGQITEGEQVLQRVSHSKPAR